MEFWAKLLVLGLRPPPRSVSFDSDDARRWMWAMAGATGGLIMALAAHIVLACGLIPAVYPGFVSAGEFAQVQRERATEREANLETQILQVVEKQCTSRGEARSSYTVALTKLRSEYQKVTGRVYPLPACDGFSREP